MWAAALVVCAVCFVLLGIGEQAVGAGVLDPVGNINPQDECVYAHVSLRMAERGEWLTPYFLGRFLLYKPPLLYWVTGASVKLFGPTRFAFRFPARLAAAIAATLLVLWVWRIAGWWQAGLAIALPLLSVYMPLMANRAMTDTLLCLWLTVAFFLVSLDPAFERWTTATGFGAAAGLAVLTKSAAGAIPFLALGVYCVLAWQRPSWRRIAWALVVAALVSLPWYLYQLAVHYRWFWNEFVEVELLKHGIGDPPQQTVGETALGFYARRFSPYFAAVIAFALPLFAKRLIARERQALLMFAWVAVAAAAMLTFQYRNATYLLLLVPPLILIAAAYQNIAGAAVALAGLYFAVFAGGNAARPPSPMRAAIEQRCESHRANEVLVVTPDDAFYAALLPLRKVRYAIGPSDQVALDFRKMGVIASVDEFLNLDRHRERFAAEMRAWGLPDDEAMASVIEVRSQEDLDRLLRDRPDLDVIYPDGRTRLGTPAGTYQPGRACVL